MSQQNGNPQSRDILARANCPIAFDFLTRQLYSTDASIYQIEPLGVAFPRNALQAQSLVRAAGEAGIAVTLRGAGTGLVGGAIGDGIIVDLSRHNRQITGLDLEKKTVHVGAGVVLDQLNAFLKPHGYGFGPDVATSSRATLGGMIANNSSGARVPIYGTTADHVLSLEILLGDGRVETIGASSGALRVEREKAVQIVEAHKSEILYRMPPGLLKRWPGYGLDRFTHDPLNLNHLLCGSEGTLGAILGAVLRIVRLPREKGMGLIFFDTVKEAMQATVELLRLKPAAIEHMDHVLLDQTRGQLQFQPARALLELDSKPCESVLLVELYGDVDERLNLLERSHLGLRRLITRVPREMNLIWALRKAGLSLLTGRAGAAKPITGIEDTAVRPEDLPAYLDGLESIMKPLDLEVCYYGHAASGLLHVRPVLDLHRPSEVRKLRHVADQVADLVRQFRGSLAAEHGVGLARTEYLRGQLGSEVLDVMRLVKNILDPKNLWNPGKIIDDGRFRVDTHLRVNFTSPLVLPFEPVLAFAKKDESLSANLEQCNGCGGCRKETPTMCPTFLATGDEVMSTRGRANVIRAVLLSSEYRGGAKLKSDELEAALSNCLSCKACTTECPSNVNMALIKAELTHARQRRYGMTIRERLLGCVDILSRIGCGFPRLANTLLAKRWTRTLIKRSLGLSDRRPLPPYARQRFDRWFARHVPPRNHRRGRVILWDDTFVRYHEPHIGQAAVEVLSAAGFDVNLLEGRVCCGRPAFSQGHLDRASRLGEENLTLLQRNGFGTGSALGRDEFLRDFIKGNSSLSPILFLEPSCFSMFVEDYRELHLDGAEEVSRRCFLFEEFADALLRFEPGALSFQNASSNVVIHAHCHAKSLTNALYMHDLATRLPGRTVTLLNTGCCGMAGAFGALEAKIELSIRVAEPLMQQLRVQPAGTQVIASGTSCRHQIADLTEFRPMHMAELLAQALHRTSRVSRTPSASP